LIAVLEKFEPVKAACCGVRVSAMAVPDASVPPGGTTLVSIGTTDNQERFRIENVIPGRYDITAGFVELSSYYPGVSAVSGATRGKRLIGNASHRN